MSQVFHFAVEVQADSLEQAMQVMQERIEFEEDYGFPYTVEWGTFDDD